MLMSHPTSIRKPWSYWKQNHKGNEENSWCIVGVVTIFEWSACHINGLPPVVRVRRRIPSGDTFGAGESQIAECLRATRKETLHFDSEGNTLRRDLSLFLWPSQRLGGSPQMNAFSFTSSGRLGKTSVSRQKWGTAGAFQLRPPQQRGFTREILSTPM